jgi:hypothetical protein
MVCRDNHPPLFVMWPKVHFRVMSSTSKITKGDKQMYLMWTVPITHLRHAFVQCCASFPLLRWDYLYAMAAAIKNMDSAVTWPRYKKKSEGSRVPDYIWGILIFHTQWAGCHQQNHKILNYFAKRHCLYSQTSNERISLVSYRFSGEALRWIKERVGEKSSTIGNRIWISTVLKNTST